MAERQLQRQRDELRAQKRKSDEENKRLRDENQRLEAAAAEAALAAERAAKRNVDGGDDVDGGDGEMDSSEGFAAWSEEERKEQLEISRGGLAYAVKRFGEASEEAEAVRGEIEALQKASREAKPFRAHRSHLERRRDKLRRQQERDGAEVAKVETEIGELQTRLDELRSSIADRTKALASVEAELTELVRKELADNGKSDDCPAEWSAGAAASTLRTMAAKPGVPRDVAVLLEQVHLAVAALAAATPVAAAAAAVSPTSGGAQQQAAQQQQRQPRQQGAGQGGGGGTSSSASSSTAAADAPIVLAPHGRWPRGAAAASTTGKAGGAAGGEAGTTTGAEAAAPTEPAAAVAPATGAPAAATPVPPPAAESEEELVEVKGEGGLHMEDVEASLNKLPVEDQAKLRRALRSRGGVGGGEPGNEESGARGRDRERSPRPSSKKCGTDGSAQDAV